MNTKKFKYLAIYIAPILGAVAFTFRGAWTFALPLYSFGLIPLFELIFKGTTYNFTEEEESHAKQDKFYDWILYSLVPIQFALLFYFLYGITDPTLTNVEIVGRVLSMGIGCVGLGINVAHELGHRTNKKEQVLSQMLLLTTLYMHFFIEHNRGHHKRVATEDDPASARYGELLYTFWFRSTFNSYFSAWGLEKERLQKRGKAFFSIHNQMIWFQFIQVGFTASIYFVFGFWPMVYFIISAMLGFLFLETVNYIEHYGLSRQKNEDGRYEQILPSHSWNSNHSLGRIMLFEVTRHSDHHFQAARKYQILRHYEEAPQMPFGYPVMILIATVPPLWFFLMHRQIDRYKQRLAINSIAA